MPEDDRQPSRERGDKRADRTGANSRDNLRYKAEDEGRRRDRGGDPGRSSSRPGQPDVARDGRGSSRDGPDRHARDRDRPADGSDRDYRRDDGSRSRGTSRPALPPPPPFPPGHGRGRGPPSNLGRPQRAVTPTNGQERENDDHRGTPGSGPRKGGTPGASHPFASEASNLLKQAKRPASTLPDPGSDDAEAGEIVQEQVGGDSRKRKHSPIVWNVPAAKTLRPDRQAALEPMGISERARQEIAALRETQLAAAGDDDIDPDAPAAMKRSPSLSDQEEHDDHHDANGHGSAAGEDPHEEPKAKGVMSRWANVDEEDGGVVAGGSSPGQEPSQGMSLGAGRVRGGDEGARTAGQGLDSSSGDEEQAGEAAQDVHPLRYDMRKECRDVHDFEKIEKISEGAYGVVYKAREKSTGRIVALKRVKMEHEVSGFPVTSVREINILLNFHHPNIVNVEEVVVSPRAPDQIYMVMEYADHDLKSLMEDKVKYSQPFSGGQVKNLMMQLLRGVEFLHSSWVIHRDLKTSNILYNGKGQLKLCDFGMARQYGDPLGVYTHNVVTLWYRAPELLFGCQEYSTAVDMWSVGCIMGEILTGKPVMPGQGEFEQIDKMVQLLGTPSLEDWPGLKDLSNYKKINLKQVSSTLRNKFTAQTAFSTGTTITEAGFDLLSRLLTWDPAKRITAREALAHRWFEEVPLPVAAILMPTFAKRKAG